jgi:hypothetical protein
MTRETFITPSGFRSAAFPTAKTGSIQFIGLLYPILAGFSTALDFFSKGFIIGGAKLRMIFILEMSYAL